MRLLGLCGSLRRQSLNRAALDAITRLSFIDVSLVSFDGLGDLPAFNPDVEMLDVPQQVIHFRQHVEAADGLVIACPEYAHGVPGMFKNALDWLVGCETITGKPFCLLNCSARASHAQGQLLEILTTMALRPGDGSGTILPLQTRHWRPDDILGDPALSRLLVSMIQRFTNDIGCGNGAG